MKEVDAQICGLNYFFKNVVKPEIYILKNKDNKFISSICVLKNIKELMIFSDCALNILPNYQWRTIIVFKVCNFPKYFRNKKTKYFFVKLFNKW